MKLFTNRVIALIIDSLLIGIPINRLSIIKAITRLVNNFMNDSSLS